MYTGSTADMTAAAVSMYITVDFTRRVGLVGQSLQ